MSHVGAPPLDTSTTSTPRRARRRWPWLVGATVVLLLAAFAWFFLQPSPADGEPVRGITEVAVLDDVFEPPVIEVDAGTTVTWTFEGADVHNVVGEGWGQEEPVATGTMTHTFDTPGTYRYTCTLHRGMDGRVDVVTAPASP